MMKFAFNHDGTWDFWTTDGLFEIEVCDDGEFIAKYTDDDTGDEVNAPKAYATFREAVDWCSMHEARLKEVVSK